MRLDPVPRAARLVRLPAPLGRRPAPLVLRAAPLVRRAAPLVRRAAPLVLAGAAGTVVGRYLEARREPQRALPPPSRPEPAVLVTATPAEDRPPHAPGEPEDLPDAEVVAEEEAGADAREPEPGGSEPPQQQPSTVDFEALASHPALSHEPPPGDPHEVAVRAALAEASSVHAAGVDVEVHDGVAYLRGRVDSPEAIGAMRRRVGELPGIRTVENLMHQPGTPPPLASERR